MHAGGFWRRSVVISWLVSYICIIMPNRIVTHKTYFSTNIWIKLSHIKHIFHQLRSYFISDVVSKRVLFVQRSFFKQFYGSVTKSEYIALRQGFIMVWYHFTISFFSNMLFKFYQVFYVINKSLQTHCPTNPSFNFHKYMLRTLEIDFKKVVSIR